MLLAADLGNTNITLGIFREKELLFSARLSASRSRTADEYAVLLDAVFRMHGVSARDIHGAVLSSELKPLTPVFSDAIEMICRVHLLVVGPGVRTGLDIRVDIPSQVGSDLAVCSVAALSLQAPPLAVIDLGTATTLTLIDARGQLTGVIICPGVRSGMEALSGAAAALPDISLEKPKALLGKNTVDSMTSGVIYGAAAMIDGLVERLREEAKVESLPVIATGGLAGSILPYCRSSARHEPELVLLGLRLVWENNRMKRRSGDFINK